jgi:hypothetical protein
MASFLNNMCTLSDQTSETVNVKNCSELHSRSGLKFTIWLQEDELKSIGRFWGQKLVIFNTRIHSTVAVGLRSTSSARRATIIFLPKGRTLTLEEFKYAFESWRQTPAIAGGEFLQLSHCNAWRRLYRWLVEKIFFYANTEKMLRLHIKLQESAVIAIYFARARS